MITALRRLLVLGLLAGAAVVGPASPAQAHSADVVSPVATWLAGEVSPRAPLQQWTFRLRRWQWVDIRSTQHFQVLDRRGREVVGADGQDYDGRHVYGHGGPGFPLRAHLPLRPGLWTVVVRQPQGVTVRLPYELRFGPLRETVVMSSSHLDGPEAVSGEVINETAQARRGIRVRVLYLDARGRELGRRTGGTVRAVVPARASAMFLVTGAAPTSTRSVDVQVLDAGRPTRPVQVVEADVYDDFSDCHDGYEVDEDDDGDVDVTFDPSCSYSGTVVTLTVPGGTFDRPRTVRDVVLATAATDLRGDVSHVQVQEVGDVSGGWSDRAPDGAQVAEAGASR